MSAPLTETEDLQVAGLHCVDCAATIEKTMAKVNGVKQVRANFASGKVKVSYDPEMVSHHDLVTCVERIGYRVTSESHIELEKKPFWRDRASQFTMVAGLLLAAGLAVKFLTSDPVLLEIGRPLHLSGLFFLATVFFGAHYFSRDALAAVRSLSLNMNFLMALAIVGAVIIGEYVEAASLAFLFSLAELLESYAVERARNSLRELVHLAPDQATIKRHGAEVSVPVAEVGTGETLVVRPGEKIALDGKVISGESSVDQAPITGESVPVSKRGGDQVYAGSLNNEGYLEIEVTHSSEDSMLARIIHLVEEAESQKAPSERFVESFARVYTPAVVGLAVLVAVAPPLFLGGAFNPWFIKALTLLVIACPCALVISTPVSVVSALTSASRNGVLIKGGVYLEEMGRINAIAFDKTGTLTHGKLQVTEVAPLNGKERSEVLQTAAALEQYSEHPIAKAILASVDGAALQQATDFQAVPGKGVTARLGDTRYAVGKAELFEDMSVELPREKLQAFSAKGQSTMLVGTETQLLGIIALADKVREDAVQMVAELQKIGKECIMITGDNPETAKAIATELGIETYYANLLPNEKVEKVQELCQQYGKVAMVGDGINDAPALAAATVGIAMGAAGADTALETADIALMADDLSKIPYLVELSRRANRVIRQNTFASILIKFSLALGVFPGVVTLVMAVLIGDMGASLGVTSNAMRLARFAPAPRPA